jgi:hypothetical protein
VLALERRPLVTEHRATDLHCFLEPFHAFARRREVDAQPVVLEVEPRGADAEERAAA